MTVKPRPVVSETDGPAAALYVYRDVLEEIRFNGKWPFTVKADLF